MPLPTPSVREPSTPEGREKHLISLAMDRAEQQLIDGTASSQVITHFLKLGTVQQELELEKLRNENLLIQAKVDNLKAQSRSEELYGEVLESLKSYGAGSIT